MPEMRLWVEQPSRWTLKKKDFLIQETNNCLKVAKGRWENEGTAIRS